MNDANRTIMVDLTNLSDAQDVATTLIGVARAHAQPFYWGSNAVLLRANPAMLEGTLKPLLREPRCRLCDERFQAASQRERAYIG